MKVPIPRLRKFYFYSYIFQIDFEQIGCTDESVYNNTPTKSVLFTIFMFLQFELVFL